MSVTTININSPLSQNKSLKMGGGVGGGFEGFLFIWCPQDTLGILSVARIGGKTINSSKSNSSPSVP